MGSCSNSESDIEPDQGAQIKDNTKTPDSSLTDGVQSQPDLALKEDSAPVKPTPDLTVKEAGAAKDITITADGSTGACTNAKDQAIINSRISTIEKTMVTCVMQCFMGGGEPCIKTCIAKATGLSDPCSTCFAKTGDCSFKKCPAECAADPNGQKCKDCLAKNCIPAFETCSGLKMP